MEFNPILEHQRIGKILDPEVQAAEKDIFFSERIKQREDLATLGGLLIEEVMAGASEAKIAEIFEGFADSGFADYQITAFKKAIKEFGRRRKIMERLINDQTDEEILEKIFSVKLKPGQKIKIIKGALALHFVLPDEVYNIVASRRGLDPEGSGGLYFGGRAKGYRRAIDENLSIGRDRHYADRIKLHEETHALYELLKSSLLESELSEVFKRSFFSNEEAAALAGEISRTKKSESKKNFIFQFWRNYITKNSDSLKNEIFAYAREDFRGDNRVADILSSSRANGGIYDYFERDQKRLTDFLSRGLIPEDLELVKQSTESFFRLEYRPYVLKSITALKKVLRYGFTIEQAMIYLLDTRLDKWPKEVDFLVEKK